MIPQCVETIPNSHWHLPVLFWNHMINSILRKFLSRLLVLATQRSLTPTLIPILYSPTGTSKSTDWVVHEDMKIEKVGEDFFCRILLDHFGLWKIIWSRPVAGVGNAIGNIFRRVKSLRCRFMTELGEQKTLWFKSWLILFRILLFKFQTTTTIPTVVIILSNFADWKTPIFNNDGWLGAFKTSRQTHLKIPSYIEQSLLSINEKVCLRTEVWVSSLANMNSIW